MTDADDFVIRPMKAGELEAMMEEHKRLNPDLPVREDVKQALIDYAIKGHPLGTFLTYVVENNLMMALGHADSYNRASIYQICHFIYNELPAGCHGSKEIVRQHYARFRSKQDLAEMENNGE